MPDPIVSRNPWSGEVIGETPIADWEAIESALESAAAWWDAGSPGATPSLCLAAATAVSRAKDDLVSLLTAEAGKPIAFSTGEVERLERTFRLAAELPALGSTQQEDLSYDPRSSDFAGEWGRVPVGTILGFVPYNWPLNLAAHKLAPALAAGCPVVLKLSPLAPLTTSLLAELLMGAGWPEGALSVLAMSNEDAQRALADPRVKMLSFTGSPAVGWMLKEQVPRKRVTLELGGNAPVIVRQDADLNHAARRASVSGFGYAGQVCISAQNVFAHRSIAAEFESLLAAETAGCPTGDPGLPETVCGPLITPGAADGVRRRMAGAEVIARAEGPDHPAVVAPTLLRALDQAAPVFQEEVFGPVLNLAVYDDEDELVASLNASRFRLQGSIFGADVARAKSIANRLRFGGVVINEAPSLRFDAMPYGGEGDSGFGREGVRFAYEEMSALRSVVWRNRA